MANGYHVKQHSLRESSSDLLCFLKHWTVVTSAKTSLYLNHHWPQDDCIIGKVWLERFAYKRACVLLGSISIYLYPSLPSSLSLSPPNPRSLKQDTSLSPVFLLEMSGFLQNQREPIALKKKKKLAKDILSLVEMDLLCLFQFLYKQRPGCPKWSKCFK